MAPRVQARGGGRRAGSSSRRPGSGSPAGPRRAGPRPPGGAREAGRRSRSRETGCGRRSRCERRRAARAASAAPAELVVVHPDRRAGRRRGRRGLGERPVDGHVGLPPSAVELRRGDDVVVQRPQGRVAEPLVVIPHLLRGQPHAHQVQAVRLERPRSAARVTGPADPHPVGLPHDRLQRGDQPARAGPPLRLAVRALGPVHRQPAGHHHETMTPGAGGSATRRPKRTSRLRHQRHPFHLTGRPRSREDPGQPGPQLVAPVLPAVPVGRLDVADGHARGLEHRYHGPIDRDQRLILAAADE